MVKKWSIVSPAFFLLIVLSVSNSQMSTPVDTSVTVPMVMDTETQEGHARQEWIKMDRDLKKAMGKILRRAMPAVMKEVYKKEVSAPCLGALMGFVKSLKESKLWAYQMIDASGRFPAGFLHGTLTSLGNYEECVAINVNETKLKVLGQYCILQLIPPMPIWKPFSSAHLTMPEVMNISSPDSLITYLMGIIHNLHVTTAKIGLCTPAKCTLDDINKLVDIIPEQLGLNWQFIVDHCEVKTEVKFTYAQFVVLYIMGVMALLVIAGSVVDRIYSSEEMETSSLKSTLFHVAKSFSFSANAKKLSDFTCPESELGFIYGIVISVFCWNVMANTFMYVNYDVVSNFVAALTLVKHLFYELALNRIMPLQTLFYLSGFVTTYRCLKSERSLNVITFLLNTFWRYTPTYALLLALLLITPTWGSGPSWASHMNPMYNRCKDNWWYNILYINNFLGAEKLCLNHTWVFAVAAQLHVIAIFILVPLKIRPKIGLLVNFAFAVASLASVALTNVYYDLPPNEMSAILHEKDRNFYAEHSYYRVYTHVCLYCTGVFVGYFMVKNPNIKISNRMSLFLWVVTGTGILAALCVVHEWREGIIPSPLLSALYTTFSKVAEAAFLSWLTVACMTGHSGGAKDVLAWRPFAFLARLTFIAYIMHVPIINMVMNFKKAQVFSCELEIFYIVISHVVGTYIVSYILHMFLEAPWLSLTDVISRRCKGRTFNSELPQEGIITEKPVKYSEKEHITITKCVNSLEKGQN